MKQLNIKKIQAIALFAFMLALLAISISSTTTTTGNNTTGITNHANLTNLDYASANHTGFTSQSVIPSCAHISGYTATINKLSNTSFECAYIVVPDYTEFAFLTDIDNLNDIKVNKSGDTMGGQFFIDFAAPYGQMFRGTNTATSSASTGSGFIIGEDDNASLSIGDRLGFNVFFGSKGINAGSNLTNSAAIVAYAGSDWNQTNTHSNLGFGVTSNGSTTRTERFYMLGSGNMALTENGKGICLDSPDGNHWFISVSNLGVLTTIPSILGCT